MGLSAGVEGVPGETGEPGEAGVPGGLPRGLRSGCDDMTLLRDALWLALPSSPRGSWVGKGVRCDRDPGVPGDRGVMGVPNAERGEPENGVCGVGF